MRRYLLTFLLFLALLVVGGLAVASLTGAPSLTPGGYVPTLSTDPQSAQVEATIFVGALVAIIILTIGLGVFLAVSFYRITLIMSANAAAINAPERSSVPKSAASANLGIPLSNPRSVGIFWVALVLIVIITQVLRYWGDPHPFGYLPGIDNLLSMQVLQLPGSHIPGLPPFIAGPGDWVTAAQLLVLVLVVAVVGVIAVGVGLARGLDRLDDTMHNPGKLQHTLPDALIPMVEQRIADLRQPRPRQRPANPIDVFLIALNVALALAIIGVVAFVVVPSYKGVAAVDDAVRATQIAALASPTPAVTQAPGGPSPADALAAQLAALPTGNATNGQALTVSNGCTACHIAAPVGPGWMASASNATPAGEGIATRAQHRFTDAGYTGLAKSANGYLLESIINPNAYVVTGFQPNVMPQSFGKTLKPQDLADIIAYLDTLK